MKTQSERQSRPNFLRYPGGKGRLLTHLAPYLPSLECLKGKYIEPFVGGAAVFFYLKPTTALLADINSELIDLYKAIQISPVDVWRDYSTMPRDKAGYYYIRSLNPRFLSQSERAARLLYLNRTCFKGMWRQNGKGQFNVGYGGQSRRWVITEEELIETSKVLYGTQLIAGDFELVIRQATTGDFLFIDPPYRPGRLEMNNAHYMGQNFRLLDQMRLHSSLTEAAVKGVKWVMTNSGHPQIKELYSDYPNVKLPKGTGSSPGILDENSEEIVVLNFCTAPVGN